MTAFQWKILIKWNMMVDEVERARASEDEYGAIGSRR